jgi:hypothetical protein
MRVAEAPVQLECKVIDIKDFGEGGGSGKLIMAQVLKMHIKKSVLGEDGKLDPFKLQLVGRMGGAWYCIPDQESMFELSQPMQPTLGYDRLPERVRLSKVLTGNDLGRIAGMIGEPTEEDLTNAVSCLKERGGNTLDLNDWSSRELSAAELIGVDRIREAAALLLL